MKKEVNYHVWNDEPIQAQYFTNIQLPHGGQINANIGAITIEKGDVIYLDHGRSMMEYTRSGKGYVAEFPFGKIHLHGVSSSVVLEKSYSMQYEKSSEEVFDTLVKKQQERIENFIPQMKEQYIIEHLNKIEKDKENRDVNELNKKQKLNSALDQMEAFFKKPKL